MLFILKLTINLLLEQTTICFVIMSLPKKVSFKEVWQILEKMGYYVSNEKGSHIIFQKDETEEDPVDRFTVLPREPSIAKGTLLSIIRQIGLSKQEFIDLLGRKKR